MFEKNNRPKNSQAEYLDRLLKDGIKVTTNLHGFDETGSVTKEAFRRDNCRV
jgi:hypothetical protein